MTADKKGWMENIASEGEEAPRSQPMKALYELTNYAVQRKCPRRRTVLDKDVNLVSGVQKK